MTRSTKDNYRKVYRRRCTYICSKIKNDLLYKYTSCCLCDSYKELQVDHIKSVYRCYIDWLSIQEANIIDNLQILCKSCNSRKLP